MHKTVTLRLDESKYDLFKKLAELENRPISNFIETATIRYIQSAEYVDEYEMEEIKENISLNESFKAGIKDVAQKNGRFI